jgi:hypothetical protein
LEPSPSSLFTSAARTGCTLATVIQGHSRVVDLCEALQAHDVIALVNWSSLASRNVDGHVLQHMESEASHQIGVDLMQRVKSGADSADLADAVVSVWRQIEAVLTPILGRRGMTVLYKRALSLTGVTVPWISAVNQQSHTEMDFVALRAACAAQSAAAVAEGARAFFKAFYDLLSSLIGASLTAQLLTSVSVTPYYDASRTPGP